MSCIIVNQKEKKKEDVPIETLILLRQNNDFSFIAKDENGQKYCIQLNVNFKEPAKTNLIIAEVNKKL